MFWILVDSAFVLGKSKFRDQTGCTILFDHPHEACRDWPAGGTFAREGLLSAKLILTLEDFDLDYIGGGIPFVSEKMRHAMALGPSEIQYFDVDASGSASLPRSKNYKIMHVPVAEDVSDLKNSEYMCRHHLDDSLEILFPITPAFRDDAHPKYEIFSERSFKQVYCTDDLALRVLQAGCSGAFFIHPSHYFLHLNRQIRSIRSIRGIEEIVGWDSSQDMPLTRLVQEIPPSAGSAVSRGEA